jgi:hypothetical protein|tara:strand:+ start:545 stop:1285 length:741 start_codon:yes stop_codon:yes gene_type:complete
MNKYYTNNFLIINVYKKNSAKSEVVTQMVYGDTFSIKKKFKKWIKIKIKEDSYHGYIRNKKFSKYIKPSHKISNLNAVIYKFPNKKKKLGKLTFGSKIKVTGRKFKFLKFKKGWINQNDVKLLSYKEKNPLKKIKIFNNVKYLWGGKSFKGIDCSALIQLFLNFNNSYCPRDAKDQVKYFKKNIKLSKIKKNDIIYWKGHVAVAVSNKNLIHAYGPAKKTVIMNIRKTIQKIQETTKLQVIKIKRI